MNRRSHKAVLFAQTVFHETDIGKMQVIIGADTQDKERRVIFYLFEFVNMRRFQTLTFGRFMNFNDRF